VHRPLPHLVALIAAAAIAGSAAAQDTPLLLDVTGGVGIPVSSFADGDGPGEGAEPGVAFGVGFTLPRSDRFALYLGFDQQRFGCEAAGCAEGGTFVATGFDLALRFALLTGHQAIPWIRVGGIATRVETRDLPEPDRGVSDLGWGGEAAFGVYVGWSWIAVHPMVTYSTVDARLTGGSTMGLRYVTPYLGISFPF
jgi:hypothetical protein